MLIACRSLASARLTEPQFFNETSLVPFSLKAQLPRIETENIPWCSFMNRFITSGCLGVPKTEMLKIPMVSGEFLTFPFLRRGFIFFVGSMFFTYEKVNMFLDGSKCSYLRVKEASITISQIQGKGTKVTDCASDWSKILNSLDKSRCVADGGHILGRHLGGYGYVGNIFPQSPTVNRGIFKVFERQIHDCIGSRPDLLALSWKFTYSSDHEFRPVSVEYKTTDSDVPVCKNLKISELFPNLEEDLLPEAQKIPFENIGGLCAFQQQLLQSFNCRYQRIREGVNDYSLDKGNE